MNELTILAHVQIPQEIWSTTKNVQKIQKLNKNLPENWSKDFQEFFEGRGRIG